VRFSVLVAFKLKRDLCMTGRYLVYPRPFFPAESHQSRAPAAVLSLFCALSAALSQDVSPDKKRKRFLFYSLYGALNYLIILSFFPFGDVSGARLIVV
jgi:hypothetical protein